MALNNSFMRTDITYWPPTEDEVDGYGEQMLDDALHIKARVEMKADSVYDIDKKEDIVSNLVIWSSEQEFSVNGVISVGIFNKVADIDTHYKIIKTQIIPGINGSDRMYKCWVM